MRHVDMVGGVSCVGGGVCVCVCVYTCGWMCVYVCVTKYIHQMQKYSISQYNNP